MYFLFLFDLLVSIVLFTSSSYDFMGLGVTRCSRINKNYSALNDQKSGCSEIDWSARERFWLGGGSAPMMAFYATMVPFLHTGLDVNCWRGLNSEVLLTKFGFSPGLSLQLIKLISLNQLQGGWTGALRLDNLIFNNLYSIVEPSSGESKHHSAFTFARCFGWMWTVLPPFSLRVYYCVCAYDINIQHFTIVICCRNCPFRLLFRLSSQDV